MSSSAARGKKRAAAPIEYDALQNEDCYNRFLCPVCMDVADRPLELACGHGFCADCLSTHLENCGEARACPVCRTAVSAGARPTPAADLAERKALRVRCACGREEPLLQLRKHTDSCKTLRGVGVKLAAKAAAATAATAAPVAPNRSTFACPFCDERHLPRADLLRHLESSHPNKLGHPGVCPVCASMPWGDPNYVSPNLIQHMMIRHRFDYAETTDYGRSEDDVLAEVLRASLTDC